MNQVTTINTLEVTKQFIGTEKVNSVDARALHFFLESGQEFAAWIKNRITQYEFTEGIDFIRFDNSIKAENTYINTKEYIITIYMAKELSMVERNEKGKEARKYFIECEKKAKTALPGTFAEALRLAADQAEQLEAHKLQIAMDAAKIAHDKPLVEFARTVEGTDKKISIGDMAKLSGKIGRNNLFKKMQEEKILISHGRDHNKPYQRYIDQGYFEVTETIVKRAAGDVITFTTHVTGKGQTWLMGKINAWCSTEIIFISC